MRILIHSYVPVNPFWDGAGLRLFHITPYLRDRNTCDLIQERWPWENKLHPLSPERPSDWLEQHYRRVWNITHQPNEKLLYGWVWHSPALQQLINDVLVTGAYDIVWSGNDTLPVYLQGKRHAHTPVIISPTDSMHLHYRRELCQRLSWQRKARVAAKWGLYALYQLRVMNRIPNWTMVAERDAQNMQRLSPRCKIQVIPNGVDVDGFSSATAAHAPCTAVFVGTLGAAAPNEIAVEWFLRQVWPIVVKAIPEARFTIVGRGASPALEALGCQSKNVTVTGFVPDTRPYFWEAGVFVLPMQSGSGIKNKLLESWAAGCAVVSNKLGVEGVQGAQHEDNVLIWDRPLEMANGLIGLMRDPIRQRELGTRGQDTVRRYYSWKVVAEKIEEYMNEIADGDSVVGVKRN